MIIIPLILFVSLIPLSIWRRELFLKYEIELEGREWVRGIPYSSREWREIKTQFIQKDGWEDYKTFRNLYQAEIVILILTFLILPFLF